MTKKICIGIPTYKRPNGLEKLLQSLIHLENLPSIPSIIVADNEGNGAGTKVVSNLSQNHYPFPLTVIAVPAQGISQARNALLEKAFVEIQADYLVMIDDDEWVEPNWLNALLEMHNQTQADAVSAFIKPEFESSPPAWTDGIGLYYRKKRSDGIVQAAYGAGFGTGSVLLSKSIYSKLGFVVRFNETYSITGSEDEEFFHRLKLSGGKFAFTR